MSGKPGIVECVTNPGDSTDALNAQNGNQPSADPDFPSQLYADRQGKQPLNPESETEANGWAVFSDYIISAGGCVIGSILNALF